MTDKVALDWFQKILVTRAKPSTEYEIEQDGVAQVELAISALQERIERGNGWISVGDRLPENNERCLVVKDLYGTPYMSILSFCTNGEEIDKYDLCGEKNIFYDYDSEYGHVSCDCVTHWMPLPEPPKENNKR